MLVISEGREEEKPLRFADYCIQPARTEETFPKHKNIISDQLL